MTDNTCGGRRQCTRDQGRPARTRDQADTELPAPGDALLQVRIGVAGGAIHIRFLDHVPCHESTRPGLVSVVPQIMPYLYGQVFVLRPRDDMKIRKEPAAVPILAPLSDGLDHDAVTIVSAECVDSYASTRAFRQRPR